MGLGIGLNLVSAFYAGHSTAFLEYVTIVYAHFVKTHLCSEVKWGVRHTHINLEINILGIKPNLCFVYSVILLSLCIYNQISHHSSFIKFT